MANLQKVYYLGGFPPGSIIQSKKVSYTVPPVGAFLEVEDFRARDLLQRNVRYFTSDPRIAEMAARGEDYETYLMNLRAGVPQPLTKEDLKRMLAEMEAEEGIVAKTEAEVPVPSAPPVVAVVEDPVLTPSQTPDPEDPVVTQPAVPAKPSGKNKENK